MFDQNFLDQTQTESTSTEFPTLPDGEYTAVITKLDVRMVGQDQDKPVMDVSWELEPSEIPEEMNMDKFTVRQSIFLDLDDTGNFAQGKGKNVQLGRLREALGQNTPAPWQPRMMEGCPARILVTSREYNGRTFNDVKGVAALGS